jgi:predicted glycoside hydrolase/deacetylase ChbG (UPF0249 family)
MSTVIILAPIVVAAWPAIAAAVTAAAAGMGLAVKEQVAEAIKEQQETRANVVEVEIEDSQVLAQALARGKEIVLTKDQATLKVSRDDRGSIKVCADEFVKKMTQCYVYNRTVTELKNKKFQMVNEEVAKDGTIRIHVRRNEE